MATVVESVAAVEARGRRRRSALKLTDAAAEAALERAGLAAGGVDLLINAGLYHDRILGEPALAALIQEDIGANPEDPHPGGHGTFSFDVANGSCGMLTGMQIADGFLRAGTVRHALVVASDADPGRRLAPGFPYAPAAAAVVCGWREGPAGIAAFRFAGPGGAAGGVGDDGGDPAGGFRATVAFERGRNTLAIEQEPGFDAAAGALAGEVATALLAEAGVDAGDLDLIVANPLTTGFLDALAAALGVPPARVGTALEGRRVHTAGLGLALDAANPGGRLDGRTALLVSAGAGPVAGAALVRR
jgi:3-oxoacyl-[acyl-carrier-protein] synthase-3